MLTAITRRVGPEIVHCALSFMGRATIDPHRAADQHRAYEELLQRLGVQVVSLPFLADAPDAPFVEDTAVVLDEVAIMTQPTLASRQTEIETVSESLAAYGPLERLSGDAHLEGGDVLRIDRCLYVGHSRRTNSAGIEQLRLFAAPHGYTVMSVEISQCLHLKTAVTFLGRGTVLANPNWVDTSQFQGCDVVETDLSEPFGGNALLVNGTVIVPASAPRTASRVKEHGFQVETVDISELEKAEAGLTCCSLLFTSSGT